MRTQGVYTYWADDASLQPPAMKNLHAKPRQQGQWHGADPKSLQLPFGWSETSVSLCHCVHLAFCTCIFNSIS